MKDWLAVLDQKKSQYRRLRSGVKEKNIDDWLKIELTYTSNAIEGNTLSRQETALVVEKGLTVEGKTLKEHQEAINHAEAWELVKRMAKTIKKITVNDILGIHQQILNKIDDQNAGRFRSGSVRIAGSTVVLPNALKVPDLVDELVKWLNSAIGNPGTIAAKVHYRLVSIHPFVDGNGRTARLLMNLILLQAGYPPAIIMKEERLKYLNSLEKAQLGGSSNDYFNLIYTAIDRTFDLYSEAVGKRTKSSPGKVLKIGELSKLTGESVATVRFWTKSGLLPLAGHTPGGYQLYPFQAVDRIKLIRKLQAEKRLTIAELKRQF